MTTLHPALEARARGFELLRQRGFVRAVVEFEGGHDDGNVTSITLYRSVDDEGESGESLEVWHVAGYRLEQGKYVPLSQPESEDDVLSEILQAPVDATFSTWDSVESTWGNVVWLVDGETITMTYDQDAPVTHTEQF